MAPYNDTNGGLRGFTKPLSVGILHWFCHTCYWLIFLCCRALLQFSLLIPFLFFKYCTALLWCTFSNAKHFEATLSQALVTLAFFAAGCSSAEMLPGPVTFFLPAVFMVWLPLMLVVIKIDSNLKQSVKFEQIYEASLSQKTVGTFPKHKGTHTHSMHKDPAQTSSQGLLILRSMASNISYSDIWAGKVVA